MTPVVDLTQARGTGPVRMRRPIYTDLLPPCNNACPAGENIQAWLELAQAGKYREAWKTLVRDNPMPAVHGRVCYHPCEDAVIAPNWTPLSASTQWSGSSVPRGRAGLAASGGSSSDRQASYGDRCGTEWAVSRLPSGETGAYSGDSRGRTATRRHDALWHPGLPAAPRGSDARDRAHRSDGRPLSSITKSNARL